MSSFGLIEENMELSHIHLAVIIPNRNVVPMFFLKSFDVFCFPYSRQTPPTCYFLIRAGYDVEECEERYTESRVSSLFPSPHSSGR